MKTIKDTQEILVRDGQKIFQHIFESTLTDEDIEKNKRFINNNITALEHYMGKMDIKNGLKRKEKELDNDYKIKVEAVANFDRYHSDIIKDLKAKKVQMKLSFSAFIAKYDEYKEMELGKMEGNLQQELTNFKMQLVDEKEKLNVYKE